MTSLAVTTSWDDGHPADLRVAEALARHGLTGTFYVPARNGEGREVMPAAELARLAAAGFEIGGHTLDHVRLSGLNADEVRRQVAGGREWLEQAAGRPVLGFAYPGGRRGWHGRAAVAAAGFRYARTTRMFCLEAGPDRLAMATTAQFHAHGAAALLRNWARQGLGLGRLRLALRQSGAGGLEAGMAALVESAVAKGGVFHLWGHGWEIAEGGLWAELDRVLALLASASAPPGRLTNAAVAAARRHGGDHGDTP